RVLRGGVGVQDALPTPAAGVAANVSVASFDADAWEAVSDRVFVTAPAAPAGGAAGSGAAPGSAEEGGGYAPNTIAVKAREVITGGRRLSNVVAGLSHDGRWWRGNIDADQLNGYVEYRPTRRPGIGGGRVYARLSRLSLPKSEAEDVEQLLDQQPATVPALDIVVEDLELRGKRLGRVEIDAVNRTVDGVREWRLNRLAMTVPEARLSATGLWSPAGASARRRAVLDFKLDLTDSGAFLERLGMGRTVRGGKGTLAGQIAWLGSPLSIDFPSLSGRVNVAIDSGQFLKVQPGAARLLSVLSLQSLPRRLALDFRDLFQEGFAFDAVTGDLTIAEGVARTNNLRMRGVQAVVLMEGSADIDRETQDLRVIVVPEINAGTASLAYAVINPAVGLGSFLAQVFLRKPLTEAGTREFHVTGPWSDPKVERVQRKLFGDDADAASSADVTPR
ncbi:MAG TPA: AsmA-like C-terminal region-containing protein, partial [Albitalea sp.]